MVVTLKDGAELQATVGQSDNHGSLLDPLTEDEMRGKFHECAGALMPDLDQRNEVIDLCFRLRLLPSVRELTAVVGVIRESSRT